MFLDTPGDTYWRSVQAFIDDELVSRGLVSPDDVRLFLVTDDCEAAAHEIRHFYENYDSLRTSATSWSSGSARRPTTRSWRRSTSASDDLCRRGRIERAEPLAIEVREGDALELQRIRFTFARHGFAQLRGLIDALNDLVDPADPVSPGGRAAGCRSSSLRRRAGRA